MSRRGQAIVEFALMFPLLMFILLGFVEVGFLFQSQHSAQTTADVLADVMAERMATMPGESWQSGWQGIVNDETSRHDCVDPQVDVTFPDGTHGPGDRVEVNLACAYEPKASRGLWPGLTIRVSGSSVVRSEGPSPSKSSAP